ncbi:hypothetical protein TYRP_021912 [Tyrophagus putrescentiae]|nr:hypothetical protein TYRP_021912 [Tyrophagus putrescentiae]
MLKRVLCACLGSKGGESRVSSAPPRISLKNLTPHQSDERNERIDALLPFACLADLVCASVLNQHVHSRDLVDRQGGDRMQHISTRPFVTLRHCSQRHRNGICSVTDYVNFNGTVSGNSRHGQRQQPKGRQYWGVTTERISRDTLTSWNSLQYRHWALGDCQQFTDQ